MCLMLPRDYILISLMRVVKNKLYLQLPILPTLVFAIYIQLVICSLIPSFNKHLLNTYDVLYLCKNLKMWPKKWWFFFFRKYGKRDTKMIIEE